MGAVQEVKKQPEQKAETKRAEARRPQAQIEEDQNSQVLEFQKKAEVKVLDQTVENSLFPEIVEDSRVNAPTPRAYIPLSDQRWVWSRSGGRCEYVSPEGVRCQSCHRLEIDHRIALAVGGTSDRSQLRILCKTHNLHQAAVQLGPMMKSYVSSLN